MARTNEDDGPFGSYAKRWRLRLRLAWWLLRGRPVIYRVWFTGPFEVYQHPQLPRGIFAGVRVGKDPDVLPGDAWRYDVPEDSDAAL